MLASSLANSEGLDMASIWLVVDAFQDAAILSREMDILSEATALSRPVALFASMDCCLANGLDLVASDKE